MARGGHNAIGLWLCGCLAVDHGPIGYSACLRRAALDDEHKVSIWSQEDCTIADAMVFAKKVARTCDRRIVVVRDPFNLMASRNAYTGEDDLTWSNNTFEVWRGHCRYLTQSDTVAVHFNRWHESEEYRRALAARLNVPFSDEWRDWVPDQGGGSTFDGTKFRGAASEMRVNDRCFDHPEAVKDADITPDLVETAQAHWPNLTQRFCGLRGIHV
jgi:hypothetical protein